MYEFRAEGGLKNKKLFASITLVSREDKVSFNFGKEPFAFDLEMKKEVTPFSPNTFRLL